MEDPSYQDE